MTAVISPTKAAPTVTADDILAAHFTLADVPGDIHTIQRDGAEGWSSANTHPVLSLLRWTTTDLSQAALDLDAVLDTFRAEGRGFDWMTGPLCAAAGLPALLEERGFIPPALEIAAMVRPLQRGERIDGAEVSGYRIELAASDDPRVWQVMAQGFDVPEDVGGIYHRAYVTASDLQRTEVHAAMDVSGGDIAAVGYLSWIGDGATALLRVSATAPEHRGRGLYRALVLRRLAIAAERGARAVVVHAYSERSRRALAELGFVDAGQLMLHRWRP